MFFRASFVWLFLAGLSAVLATSSIQPPSHLVHPISVPTDSLPSKRGGIFSDERETNAKRLAAGLTPLRPSKLKRVVERGYKPYPPPYKPPPPPPPPPAPSSIPGKSFTGYIQASSSADGSIIGFLGKTYETFGEYGAVSDKSDALVVTINNLRPNSFNGPLNIVQLNGDPHFRRVGLIEGFANNDDDLAIGSANYAYIGGTRQTPAFDVPEGVANSFSAATGLTETSESAVWIVNTHTSELTAEWINDDSSAAPSNLAFLPGDGNNVFLVVGDDSAFTAEFGAPTPVKLHLVPL